MDERRFDAWARALAGTEVDRRGVDRSLIGGALVGASACLRRKGLAATCRSAGARCRRDGDCCSFRCRRNGRCGCSGFPPANGPGGGCLTKTDCCNDEATCLKDPRTGTGTCCVPEGGACASARQCCGIFACTNGFCGG